MTETTTAPLPTGPQVDRIVASGWDGVAETLNMLVDRLLEVAFNLAVHRPNAMPREQINDCGIYSIPLHLHVDDTLYLLKGYRPANLKPGADKPKLEFAKLQALESNPPDRAIKELLRKIDEAVIITIDAVDVLVKKPGMPSPTPNQLITTYCGLRQLRVCEPLLNTVALQEITPGNDNGEDYFGVGFEMSQRINEIIPPRCVPIEATITLATKPSLDCVIAAFLLSRYVIGGIVYIEFVDDPDYDPSLTHAEHHATIGVGRFYHCPGSLSFDARTAVGETTNTELVIEHAEKLEIPMDFTSGLVEIARGDKRVYKHEVDMIEAVFEACESESQSINVVEMLLADRFPVSEAYRSRNAAIQQEALERDPEYLKYLPRVEKPSLLRLQKEN